MSVLPTNSNQRCAVCNERVLYQNFGTKTCNGCAAFFRRTIASKKRYLCRQSADCNIEQAKHKRRCPYCRFERCVALGMDVSKILVRLSNEAEKPLRQLIICRRANYTSRRKNSINLFGSFLGYEAMKNQPRNAESLIRATAIEKLVMMEFLRNVGLIEADQCNGQFESSICGVLLHTWLVCESIFFTRFHSGQSSKQLYYPDESFIRLDPDYLELYYRSNGSIRDPDLIARSALPLLSKVIESADLLTKERIDEQETAALLSLLLNRRVIQKVGLNKRMSELRDKTFRELGFHFKNIQTPDVAERFDSLMQCLESIESADRACDELALMVQLSYKSTGLNGYEFYRRGDAEEETTSTGCN
ncbi:Nuclear hormone receptor family member nhr-6 [Aphelenchoides fujianensis]|nr:Nuclear hormone receptor family member nhr-6 [Aphelenchoides fujianensis]